MKRPEPDSPDAQQRSTVAADWLARRDRGFTAAEQDEFMQWLAADPRHGEWFALHRRTVADFTALAQWRPEHSDEPNPDLLAPARPRPRWWAPALVAAAAAIALSVAWWRVSSDPAVPAAVAGAEFTRRVLEDGSSVDSNRGAVVEVAFTPGERRVTLVRGEAYFSVAKNPARPFVVRAAGMDVRAVGTAFSVRLDSATVEVVVTEGRVGLQSDTSRPASFAGPSSPASASPMSNTGSAGTLVSAGQRATASRNTAEPPQLAAATPAQISHYLAWQPELLDFSSAPLSAAVAEFNRRNRVQFEIADARLAAMPVVASIRSDNVEGFAQFLAAAPGVELERRSPELIVVRRK